MEGYGNPFPYPPPPPPYGYESSPPQPPSNPYYPSPTPSYPPTQTAAYHPPAYPPPPLDYDPYRPYPYPYPYPPTHHDPNSSSFHQPSGGGSAPYDPTHPAAAAAASVSSSYPPSHQESFSSEQPTLSAQSSSSSLYPIDDVLANVHISDHSRDFPPPPSLAPASASAPAYPFYSPSHSGSFAGGSQHGAIVPVAGGSHHHGAVVQYAAGPGMQVVPYKVQASLKVLLLHGNLDIWVCEARNLPNLDQFSKTLGDLVGPRLGRALGDRIDHMSRMTSDPYVTITVSDAAIGRTYVISNSENPVWMQHFYVPVAHQTAEVKFNVKDSDVVGAQLIGTVSIPAEWIYSGEKVEGIYPILGQNGKECKPGATLRLSIQYHPIERISMYHNGVGAGPYFSGVPGTYFPLRIGCKVTLYQDAHVPDGCLPEIRLGNGAQYAHGKCWLDIFNAINQAQRLIYIVGWSVFHTVRLVRDSGYASPLSLGDLLKIKSQEGVRVLLLVWDDPTSRNLILGIKTDGIMGTRDEETRRFFKHSSVQVLLCPRSAGKRHSFVKQQETGTLYTHHQKQVIVDADAGNNKRKIIAFVGGLDLCGGRYDTPEHPLFRTLQLVHKDDYHNPNFAESDNSGPREPWHDMHSRIDGPAAYDLLTNFEERWIKASKRHGIKKLKRSYDDSLLKIDRIKEIIGANDSHNLEDSDPEAWHVQIFRSIDSNSAKGFPKDPKDATRKNLVCGKNILIDMSIHTAYVHAIRSAQHFIYIENQYFLGSSFNWDSNKDIGANNLIPMEIALKIANKIKAKERFSVYIVIPMWPEGNPNGAPTQRILYWQNKTMQMMYETVYTALKEVGLENTYEPQDYLNFFCLGNREAPDINNMGRNIGNNAQASAKKNRRFMIYVHSKGMIIDDEYVIIGSANINQRSLEGTRDTEIAMGAYQPQHTWARRLSSPRGQIYGYRMSLWAEHTGALEECFDQPESLECMRRVSHIGELNWKDYASDEVKAMRGHLLKYPVSVDHKGKVKPLQGSETFPDIGGNICGSFLAIQENLTI